MKLATAYAPACCLLLLLFARPGPAEAAAPFTPRQREIMAELLSAAPPDYAGGGIWMLSAWDGDAGLEELVPIPGGSGDAAALFKRLEDVYQGEKASLAGGGEDSRGVLFLMEAAGMAECRLSPIHYPEYDSVTAKQPDFAVLRAYLEALRRRAAREEREGRPAGAEEALRAALLCGRHLARDRSSLLVYVTGLVYKLRGAQDYEAFLRRSGRDGLADKAGSHAAAMVDLLRLFHWKSGVALGEMKGFACLPSAVRIAGDDAEACWRKEALLRLGILRHGVVDREGGRVERNSAFEREAERALSLAVRRDPLADVRRLAAWAALNARPEMYASLRHDFSAGAPGE